MFSYTINHTNAHEVQQGIVDGTRMGTGRVTRDLTVMPVGFSAFAPVLPVNLISWSDMSAAIKDANDRQAQPIHHIKRAGYKRLNQQQTEYCWANAVINTMRAARAFQGEPYADLSPASVAAPIRGYTNQGGLGIEALEYVAKHGACTTDVWGANSIDARLDNATSRANRANYTATNWFEAVAQNGGDDAKTRLQVMLSCVLQGDFFVAAGFAWWSHEVQIVEAVEIEAGSFGPGIENSWGETFGDQGFANLQGDHAIPMDLVALGAASGGKAAA